MSCLVPRKSTRLKQAVSKNGAEFAKRDFGSRTCSSTQKIALHRDSAWCPLGRRSGWARFVSRELHLFGDPGRSITDQVLRAYEHNDPWVNRMILGDALVVMNSLLHYESLGGQVQMIYMDPPYGVKFGSNFQPFIRKRDVKNNDDDDLTREPEMVQAYRDTVERGCDLAQLISGLQSDDLLHRASEHAV